MENDDPSNDLFRPRRRNRVVDDTEWIDDFLKRSSTGTLATVHEGRPFAHPNLFLYDAERRALYFHTAKAGRTRSNIEFQNQACFTVFEIGRILPAENAVDVSTEYASVMVFGNVEIVEDPDEIRRVLQAQLDKYLLGLEPERDYRPFGDVDMHRTTVYRLDIEHWSAKRNRAEPDHPRAFFFPNPEFPRPDGDLQPPRFHDATSELTAAEAAWPRLIGILGGMGPHAHLALERRLLGALQEAQCDQDYPPWLLASASGTPDRTQARLSGKTSPVPSMHRALTRLQRGGADFAVIACVTAHAFLDDLRQRIDLPILDLLETTSRSLAERYGPDARIGLLATDGTLQSNLFPDASQRVAPKLKWLSPLDLAGGAEIQASKVMNPIYGIKKDNEGDATTGLLYRDALLEAASSLVEAGADAVVCGCTEISLALGFLEPPEIPLVDPLEIAARSAIAIAAGRMDLPS